MQNLFPFLAIFILCFSTHLLLWETPAAPFHLEEDAPEDDSNSNDESVLGGEPGSPKLETSSHSTWNST